MPSTDPLAPPAPPARRPLVRPVFAAVALGLAAIVVAGLLFVRWQQAPIHGATELFTRTTDQGVTITVERGDVRVDRISCEADGAQPAPCTRREPGLLVRLALPDGRRGRGSPLPDAGFGASSVSTAVPGPGRIVLEAGLGLPPGSEAELFLVARTGPDVRRVRATRGDGTIDEMAPVDGIAVLTTTTGWARGDRVVAVDAAGREIPLR